MKFQMKKNKFMFSNEIRLTCQLFWTWMLQLKSCNFSSKINALPVYWLVEKTEIVKSTTNTQPKGIYEQLITFINVWPAHQWISSLVTLVLMYWFVGTWYNKKLIKQGGWISWQTRILMIIMDLIINLGLGIYYMAARDTIMGQLMFRCPIAISPLIFAIEFLSFVWYYKKYVLNPDKDKDKDKR